MNIEEIIKRSAEQFCDELEEHIPLDESAFPKFMMKACVCFATKLLTEYMQTNEIKYEE